VRRPGRCRSVAVALLADGLGQVLKQPLEREVLDQLDDRPAPRQSALRAAGSLVMELLRKFEYLEAVVDQLARKLKPLRDA
jgi:hypothetical protein